MATEGVQIVKPLTPDHINLKNITLGPVKVVPEYNFKQYRIGYTRKDVMDDKFMVKIPNVTVTSVYLPSKLADGTPAKNPKHSVGFVTTDPVHIKFFRDLNASILELAVKNSMEWFGEQFTTEGALDFYKPFGVFSTDGKECTFTVEFPYNTERVDTNVNIKYLEPDVPPEVVESTVLTEKLGRGTIVDIFLIVTRVKISSANEFKCMRTLHAVINVNKYEKGTNGPTPGIAPGDFKVDKIIMGDVGSSPNIPNSKLLKPKYNFTPDGGAEVKPRYVSITLENVRCRFRKAEPKKDETTGVVKVPYDIIFNPEGEHMQLFTSIDDYILRGLINLKLNAPAVTKKKFKPAVTISDKKSQSGQPYPPSVWFNVYVKDATTNPDFGGNFYRPVPDGNTVKYVQYTNEQVDKHIFNTTQTCTLTVYLKHVWLGQVYSVKYSMGNVIVNAVSVQYDLSDGYVDIPAVSVGPKYSASADLDVGGEEDQLSDQSD